MKKNQEKTNLDLQLMEDTIQWKHYGEGHEKKHATYLFSKFHNAGNACRICAK